MKKIKVLVLIAIVSLGLNTLNAQEKIGHISTDLLISLMPETKALNAELEKLGKTYEAELKSQTDEVNQSRRAEVQNDQQSLYQASQIAREDIGKKRDEKLKPILEKAKKAIDDVAKANGYKYVLEASTLVVANGTDILPLVKTKLGIQ
jgi:outer membrane protein